MRLSPLTRAFLKDALAHVAYTSFALALLRSARRHLHGPVVRIFGYHRVVPDVATATRSTMVPLCVSTRAFAAHIEHLLRHYEMRSLEETAEFLSGERPFPKRDIAILTFDDGYRDVLEHAAPLLHKEGLPATIFVPTWHVDTGFPLLHDRIHALCSRAARNQFRLLAMPAAKRLGWSLARADTRLADGDVLGAADALLYGIPRAPLEDLARALAARLGEPEGEETPPLLDWAGVLRLRDLGFTIGSHAVTHAHLPMASHAELLQELVLSRETIAGRVGAPPRALSYPAGRYDMLVIRAAQAAGYRLAVTTEDRENRLGADLYRLGRKVLTEAHSKGTASSHVPSRPLIAVQLDGLFTSLRLSKPQPGDFRLGEAWVA